MKKGFCLISVLAWPGLACAQEPPKPPVESSPVVTVCPKDNALCIISERLKNKDFGIGSRSGMTPGLVAKEAPPGAIIPGGRVDQNFIREFKT